MAAQNMSWAITLTPAIFGLLAVLLGCLLTTLREWWLNRQSDAKNARLLAVQIVGQLDRYIFGCSRIITDDVRQRWVGTETDSHAQVQKPTFNPELALAEWRSIPTDQMYEILDLSYKAEVAAHRTQKTLTRSQRLDYFEQRRLEYINLGLQAAVLADRLRRLSGLPGRRIAHWDPTDWMTRCKGLFEAVSTQRI